MFLKKMPCLRRPMYLTRVLSVLQKCGSFRKDVSNVFESLFESVVDCGF